MKNDFLEAALGSSGYIKEWDDNEKCYKEVVYTTSKEKPLPNENLNYPVFEKSLMGVYIELQELKKTVAEQQEAIDYMRNRFMEMDGL